MNEEWTRRASRARVLRAILLCSDNGDDVFGLLARTHITFLEELCGTDEGFSIQPLNELQRFPRIKSCIRRERAGSMLFGEMINEVSLRGEHFLFAGPWHVLLRVALQPRFET